MKVSLLNEKILFQKSAVVSDATWIESEKLYEVLYTFEMEV